MNDLYCPKHKEKKNCKVCDMRDACFYIEPTSK